MSGTPPPTLPVHLDDPGTVRGDLDLRVHHRRPDAEGEGSARGQLFDCSDELGGKLAGDEHPAPPERVGQREPPGDGQVPDLTVDDGALDRDEIGEFLAAQRGDLAQVGLNDHLFAAVGGQDVGQGPGVVRPVGVAAGRSLSRFDTTG